MNAPAALAQTETLVALRRLFAATEAAGLRPMVLRGYTAEEIIVSADIDIYLPAGELGRFADIARGEGWLRRRWRLGRDPHVFFERWSAVDRRMIVLDVSAGLRFGRTLATLTNEASVLPGRRNFDGIPVPDAGVALFLFALHVCLDKESLSTANHTRATAMGRACEGEGAFNRVREAWGPEAAAMCLGFLEQIDSDAPDESVIRMLIIALPCLRPGGPGGFLSRAARKLRRAARNLFGGIARVAFVGPDGSGKSTLAARVAKEGPWPAAVVYLGLNHYETPLARALASQRDRFKDQGRSIRSLPFLCNRLLWAVWWPAEVRRRVKSAGRDAAVLIFDRYPVAALKKSRRPDASLLEVLARTIAEAWQHLFLPRVDLLVFCDGEPDAVWSRKREYDFETFQEVRDRHIALTGAQPAQVLWLDTTGNVDTACARVHDTLFQLPGLQTTYYDETIRRAAGHEVRSRLAEAGVGVGAVRAVLWSGATMGRFKCAWLSVIWRLLTSDGDAGWLIRFRNEQWEAKPARGAASAWEVATQGFRELFRRLLKPRPPALWLAWADLDNTTTLDWAVGNTVNATAVLGDKHLVVKRYGISGAHELNRRKRAVEAESLIQRKLAEGGGGAALPAVRECSDHEAGAQVIRERVEGMAFGVESAGQVRQAMAAQRDFAVAAAAVLQDSPGLAADLSLEALIQSVTESGEAHWIRDSVVSACREVARRTAHVPLALSHGDYWHGNLLQRNGEILIMDCDRVGLYPQGYDTITYFFHLVSSATQAHPVTATGRVDVAATVNSVSDSPQRATLLPLLAAWREAVSLSDHDLRDLEAWYFMLLALHALRCERDHVTIFLKAPAYAQHALALLDNGESICESLLNAVIFL